MVVVLSLVFYGAIGLVEINHLWRMGDRKKIILYVLLLGAALTLSILMGLGIKPYSPSDAIQDVVKALIGVFKGGK